MATSLLYITDVFCPWCYGFAPVMSSLAAEFGLPVRVLCGCLMENPVTMADMGRKMTKAREFFARLSQTTGQTISERYFENLYGEAGKGIVMDSGRAGVLYYALKSLAPGHDLAIMEALEYAFYGEGRDVFSEGLMRDMCARFGVDEDALRRALAEPDTARRAEEEAEEGLDIMGDIILYPTLYVLKDGQSPTLAVRGFTQPDEAQAKLGKALKGLRAGAGEAGPVCGPDGICRI